MLQGKAKSVGRELRRGWEKELRRSEEGELRGVREGEQRDPLGERIVIGVETRLVKRTGADR